jgi:uncharacterized damage-inducible protein DinB
MDESALSGQLYPPFSRNGFMRRRHLMVFALLAIAVPAGSRAQTPAMTNDLIKTVNDVEQKLVGLANAMSAEQWNWRPAQGVRSVHEVLMHVAADNYFIPAAMGVAAPAETKITGSDYPAVQAFESQKLSREATIAELKTSFEHMRKAMASFPESRMNDPLKIFGQDFTVRSFLILGTTHLHEHLGQMIAYARTNNVKPPWSR